MPPNLERPIADWERLAKGLETSMGLVRRGEENLPKWSDLKIDYACLRTLSQTLREANWEVTVSVWEDKEVVQVQPGLVEESYGAAVDIGSTTIALYLCDLRTGEILAAESEMNPQIVYGEDIMSRIQYTIEHKDGLEKLHKAVIDILNKLLIQAVEQPTNRYGRRQNRNPPRWRNSGITTSSWMIFSKWFWLEIPPCIILC